MAGDEAGAPRTIIFDLDRTLIDCDSFADCLNGLLRRNWWRLGTVMVASPLLLPLWAAATTRSASLRGLLWCATAGLSGQRFREALSAHGRQLATCVPARVHVEGLKTLQQHRADGDRVVIVTGSGHDLARALCDALGLGDVVVVGSTFGPWLGGWIVDEHCAGERKISSLAAAGLTPPWSVVYTDSASDLPLLRLAEERRLVNPRPSALRAVSRALGADRFEVLRWT